MPNQGYYRFPTIHGDNVYFVAEDDVWCVSASGGVPRRLTAGLGEMGKMAISPDGAWLAVTAREEKHTEVYLMPADGGPLRRLTYLGADSRVKGFTPGGEILFASNADQPFARTYWMYAVSQSGGNPDRLPFGRAVDLSFGPNGRKVLGRNTGDPASWKRYRGGTAGKLWIDNDGNGEFQPLLDIKGNIASPIWIRERIFFLSDHEGIGNLYSCNTSGKDIRRHTNHEEFFARWASSDGRRIVYQCGALVYMFDPESSAANKIEIDWHGPSTQTQRKFIRPEPFLEDYNVHPAGHSLALECRGKPLTFGFWEEAVHQHGIPDGVRYRFPQWLSDGRAVLAVSDSSGEERIEIFEDSKKDRRLDHLELGRVVTIVASPTSLQIALTNHRHELLLVDLNTENVQILDRSPYSRIEQIAWSPDGNWIAYDFGTSRETTAIKLHEVGSGRSFLATTAEFRDFSPAFDPEGKFLYFLSHRSFDPVYDSVYFDLNFPRTINPCLIVLSPSEPSPFIPKPRGLVEEDSKPSTEPPLRLRIDPEGIERRILAFPVREGIYRQIAGIAGKVFFTSFPIEGSLNVDWRAQREPRGGELQSFDFKTQKHETALTDVTWFKLSSRGSTMVYRAGHRLRAINVAAKIEKPSDNTPSRQSGWIDLARLKVSVDPKSEWKQMYRDVWRLQREFFWVEDMSGVDWQLVYDRYAPLLERVSTRAEFSDVIWEMQGELGTSHAYEIGGDYRPAPDWPLGHLGADFTFDNTAGGYRISHIVRGDSWDSKNDSPLNATGLNIREGDLLLAVAGRRLTPHLVPNSQLVNRSGVPVEITVASADGTNIRSVSITTLKDDTPVRYREWVEQNRRIVHDQTNGRTGYVHIPDMSPRGYSEFHRYYSLEAERESLIIDVRYNGGGHVSPLILEKLGRKRLGYDFSRWGVPVAYPPESVLGPMVAITNEHAGSDGDMFSHAFKMMKLGPLIGKRTWGGVIGISPRYRLVDGSITTQPEYSFWFKDVGWAVENYGTEPDIDVDITPQDYAAARDPQLEKAIELILQALKENPPEMPQGSDKPLRALPRGLPKS